MSENPESKFPKSDGMTVPPGYFADLRRQMMEKLPESQPQTPVLEMPRRSSTWEKVRAYVYMAAMFAGVWCMMQMFHLMGSGEQAGAPAMDQSLLAEVVSNDAYLADYLGDMTAYDLYNDLYESGFEFDE